MLANKEYKDSGIVWLGHIPAHWDVTNYRRLFCRRKEYDDNPDKQVLSLTIEGVKRKNENFGKMAEDFTGHQIVRKDDLVFTPRDFDATPILSGIAPCDGCISNLYFVLYPRTPDIDVNFYNYFMWGVKWGGDIWKKLSYGMRFSYNYDQFCALPAIKIPLKEQKAIANYLDNECARIDNIVEKQRNIIEKLKEYKKSVITEAVTKGLNPNVKMKNSGIEWIGDIPEHWEISKVFFFFTIQLGKMLQPNPEKTTDIERPYLCAVNFGNNTFKLNTIKTMWFSQEEFEYYDVRAGDLFVVEGGDVASSAFVLQNLDGFGFQNALHRVRAFETADTRFLRYILIVAKARGYIDLICNKATIAHFSKDKFENMPFVVAPLSEQKAIADYLDQKCAEIDSVIEKREKMIDLLTEYKKSLIYECVTGKKEVA